tara:strand:+ start:1964 stop:2380 length:417 start_codon:yes stop_codon:yes gene_type:complete
MTLIYKIYDNTNGDSYIGSTDQKLHRRLAHHFSKHNRCSSNKIINNNNYTISIVEECDKCNRNIREQYWMDNTEKCINIKKSFWDEKSYKQRYCLENVDNKKIYDKKRREWIKSWGGKLDRYIDNNMLRINPFLFVEL